MLIFLATPLMRFTHPKSVSQEPVRGPPLGLLSLKSAIIGKVIAHVFGVQCCG